MNIEPRAERRFLSSVFGILKWVRGEKRKKRWENHKGEKSRGVLPCSRAPVVEVSLRKSSPTWFAFFLGILVYLWLCWLKEAQLPSRTKGKGMWGAETSALRTLLTSSLHVWKTICLKTEVWGCCLQSWLGCDSSRARHSSTSPRLSLVPEHSTRVPW